MNITPTRIDHLEPNQIFVFGSNTEGRHGRGAAKQALQWGAIYGKGEGCYGHTYAIPTRKFVRDSQRNAYSIVTLSLSEICIGISKFIAYTTIHKDKIFLVTEIGCGLAGYKPQQIAPFFLPAKDYSNVCIPRSFIKTWEGH
jgi:hypothetical protein